MTVTELIEKYVEQSPDRGERPFLTNFAIELLELMRAKTEFGEPVRHTHEAIDKALEKLRK